MPSDLEGNGIRTIVVPSDSDEIWADLDILMKIKSSGYTNTLILASQLLDALFKKGEIKTEQKYQNAINKFKTQ